MYADTQRSFELARRQLVEDCLYVGEDASADVVKLKSSSTVRRFLLDQITSEAKSIAMRKGMSVEQFYDLAQPGIDVVDDFQWSMTQDGSVKEQTWNFWRHQRNPMELISASNVPAISRDRLEHAASAYLALQYRERNLERLLVDALIAAELYAFADEKAVLAH